MGNPYRARKTVKTRSEAKPVGVVVGRFGFVDAPGYVTPFKTPLPPLPAEEQKREEVLKRRIADAIGLPPEFEGLVGFGGYGHAQEVSNAVMLDMANHVVAGLNARTETGEEPDEPEEAEIDLTVEASTVSQLPVEPIPDTVRGLRVWIGDNPELAQMILDIEQASDEPRKTVIEHCQRVLRNG